MSNKFLNPSIIAKEAVMVLENNLIAGSLAYKNFSSEFSKVGDTITVRKPAVFQAKDFNDQIEIQNATETGITLTLDKFKDVSFAVTSKDLSLSLEEFSKQLLQPAMRALHQQIDSDVLSVAPQFPGYYQKGATPVLADFAKMGLILNDNKAPMDSRYAVLNATHYSEYVSLDSIARVDASGSSAGLRQAMLGRVLDFDTYMDQNMPSLPVVSTITGKASASKGDDCFVMATSADVPVGSLFSVAGDSTVYQVIGVDLNAKKVYVDEEIAKATAEGGANVTFQGGNKTSLFFHKNAIALVSAPLESMAGNNGRSATESFNGITIRVTMDYDINTKKDIVSVDCLYGVKVIDKALGARLISA